MSDINPLLPEIEIFLLRLQNQLCEQLSALDSQQDFLIDQWQRPEDDRLQGYGKTCVLEGGDTIEKAGVNFSFISANDLPAAATTSRPHLANSPYQAMGLSIVVHPRNPYAPTAHANVRVFAVFPEDQAPVYWFGGGYDLTPYYLFEEDAQQWHADAKALCDPFGESVYSTYKQWCDDYFYIPHRQEHRGIGGLFYDDQSDWGAEQSFAFMQAVGNGFMASYLSILERRINLPYGETERAFQLYRRGRYVEFNLVYDRGTIFGLQSGGRIESILMSLPPMVRYDYNWQPEPESAEAKLYEVIRNPREWV